MAILVTGGAGYIGSHTILELLNAGYNIVVVDNFSNGKEAALKRVQTLANRNFPVYDVDLLNEAELVNVFRCHDIDAVIHFASLKAVGESLEHPLRYYQNNVIGTLHLVEVMSRFSIKKLVFSSSAAVYGLPDSVPVKEDADLRPISPYGRTKKIVEEVLWDLYHSDSEWSITLLRYFNPVGAHESGWIGEDLTNTTTNLLPHIAKVAVGMQEHLFVYGNDYPTIDGTGVRDYVHVVDLALGHIKALEKVRNSLGIDVYNLGTGKGYSVLEILAAFENVSGVTIPYRIVERRQGDVAICYAEVSKAKEELGWTAKKDLLTMCLDMWNWLQTHPNGYG